MFPGARGAPGRQKRTCVPYAGIPASSVRVCTISNAERIDEHRGLSRWLARTRARDPFVHFETAQKWSGTQCVRVFSEVDDRSASSRLPPSTSPSPLLLSSFLSFFLSFSLISYALLSSNPSSPPRIIASRDPIGGESLTCERHDQWTATCEIVPLTVRFRVFLLADFFSLLSHFLVLSR